MSWIQTYSGKRFDPFNPSKDSIVIEDIAHALAHSIRFSGHLREPYTTAQHSVCVSWLVPERPVVRQLQALLHDGGEAYVNDVVRPVKNHPSMAIYREIETLVSEAVFDAFDVPLAWFAGLREADDMMLRAEAEKWFTVRPVWADEFLELEIPVGVPSNVLPLDRVWSPSEAKSRFLERFYELDAKRASL